MPGVQFSPSRTIAITGDTVEWKNTSSFYVHNVKSTNPPFTSEALQGGETFSRAFDSPANVPYVCDFHTGMSGRVDVYHVYLSSPPSSVLHGRSVALAGLAHAGGAVTVERVAGGAPVATATADPEGRFAVSFIASGPSFDVRPVEAAQAGPVVKIAVRPKLTISARKVRRGHRVSVVAAPAQHGATFVVERAGSFGWRRLARGTLNSASKASLRVSVSGTARIRARVTRAVGGYAPGVSGTIRIRG